MQEHETEVENSETSPPSVAVELVFDDQTEVLSAHLQLLGSNQYIDLLYLKNLIADGGYLDFDITNKMLEDLLLKVNAAEEGVFPLANKPKYTEVTLHFDEVSKTLSAGLNDIDTNPRVNLASLQQMIREQGFSDYKIETAVLQELLERVENNEVGFFEIGAAPEYTAVEFSFNNETNILSAELTLSYDDYSIDLGYLQSVLEENSFDEFFFEKNELETLLSRIGHNERGVFKVGKKVDAELSIEVTADKMSALVTSSEAFGGKRLTEPAINLAIEAANIDRNCCDQSVLDELVAGEIVSKQVLAEGREAVSGEDAQFTALVEEVIYLAPSANAQGVVNHNEVSEFTVVEVGTPLMRKDPATPGVNGNNVLGEVVLASAGKDIPFEIVDEGSEPDPEDCNLLVAIEKGHPCVKKSGVGIDKTLKMNNVNPRVGNVNFDGSLMIAGDVTAGVEVVATGSIVIKGIVTHASIICGGDLTINGGVIGDVNDAYEHGSEPKERSTYLKAGGKLKAQYLSLSTIETQGDIEVAEYCSHCDIKTQSQLLLGLSGGKGRLMGGRSYARDGVIAKVMGTDANIKTYVLAGYPEKAQQRYDDFVSKRAEIIVQANQLAAQLNDIIQDGKKASLPAQKVEKARAMRNDIEAMKKEVVDLAKVIRRLKAVFKKYRHISIQARITIYPNVLVTVNCVDFPIRNESKGGKFIRVGKDIRWEA